MSTHTLYELLIQEMNKYGPIVYACEDIGILITWNTKSTFNIWNDVGEGKFENTDCFTRDCDSYERACEIATDYMEQE
jgi:hypothetical protein